jgi:hypothetical protein
MLVSFLLLPGAFGADAVVGKACRQVVEVLFNDILTAGIIVDYPGRPTLDQVRKELEQLPPELKQRPLILMEEMLKQRKMIVVTLGDRDNWTQDRLVACLKPDAAIVPPNDAARVAGVAESVSIGDYLDSASRSSLISFLSPTVPAANLTVPERARLIGRFLKYTRAVAVIDKMIGRSAKSGRLEGRFVDGLRFVADCWTRNTVHTSDTLELSVVTVAGELGGAHGYADPQATASVIGDSLRSLHVRVKIVLKQDSSPSVFHARFLKAKGRCLKLDPGVDGLACGGIQCGCLVVDPPCRATNELAAKVLRLPELKYSS